MTQERRLTWSEIHFDAVRGLAALIVCLGHARGLYFSKLIANATPHMAPGNQPALSDMAGQMTIGREAVMIFFVLSGYLVGGSVLKAMAGQSWSWRRYLLQRLTRLWTVLIPAVLIGVATDYIGLRFFNTPGSLYSFPAGQEYAVPEHFNYDHIVKTILGNIVFLQTIFVPTAGTNIALWSLSNEFWYYLIFPLAMLALQRRAGGSARIGFALAGGAILWMIGLHASYLFLVWLLGAGVAAAPKLIPARWVRPALAFSTLLLAALFLSLKKIDASLYAKELIISLSASLHIYTIKCQDDPADPSIYSAISKFFSKISYTMYLFHLPFIIFITNFISRPWAVMPLGLSGMFKFSLAIALVIAWSYALYWLFEGRTDAIRAAIGSALSKKGLLGPARREPR